MSPTKIKFRAPQCGQHRRKSGRGGGTARTTITLRNKVSTRIRRSLAAGCNQPKYRTRCCLGSGTSSSLRFSI
jgi:hypothetical protein